MVARITGMERNNLSTIEITIRDLLAPLESGVTVVSGKFKTVGNYFGRYNKLYQENNLLNEEIERLRKENMLLTEARLENLRLRELLNMREDQKQEWEAISAKIIGRDLSNWYHSVIIDKGTEDGLKKNMTVINQDGLVGRIISTTKNTSEVLLVVDKEGAVGSLVQLSRTPGVVEGIDHPKTLLRMIHIPHDAEIEENQVVITSGLGGVFPKGIRIGYIKQIILEPNGLMKQAIVQPFVDFERLEEVLVLKPVKEVSVQ